MFVNEFNDYEEMISVLSKNKFVSDKIKNLDDYEKRKVLVSLSSKFKVGGPEKKDKDKIYFRWHDVDEGIQLFDKALQLTLINVKNRLLM